MFSEQKKYFPRPLSDILANHSAFSSLKDCCVQNLTSDSRTVMPGDMFVALRGASVDGRDYISQALERGASAVLAQTEASEVQISWLDHSQKVPIIHLPNLSLQLGAIASCFYGHPSRQMTVMGVTGTNGKTSISYYLSAALSALNKPCAMIGTLGSGFVHQGPLQQTGMTTPDAITLQRHLAQWRDRGAECVAMEVSSHALAQERVASVAFDGAILTNISQDHLDYHQTLEDYACAKKKLFTMPRLCWAVLNQDDSCGRQWLEERLLRTGQMYAYALQDSHLTASIRVRDIHYNQSYGFSAYLSSLWGEGELKSSLIGEFNLYNLLAVLSVLCLLEIPWEEALKAVSDLQGVPGRMQMLGGGQQHPWVVVDYAHTPHALEQALLALRQHNRGKLWCIFGCGGERDQGKRALMGQIAERYSDELVITNDNPRGEDPEKIAQDIIKTLLCPWAVDIELDRRLAIKQTIQQAKPGDVVLIAGKGHETHQHVGASQYAFSDVQQAQCVLEQ